MNTPSRRWAASCLAKASGVVQVLNRTDKSITTSSMSSSKLVSIEDYHIHARTHLPKNAYDYYRTGSEDEITLYENEKAFRRIYLMPRVLRNVSNVDTSVVLLVVAACNTEIWPNVLNQMIYQSLYSLQPALGNIKLPSPICIAPTAAHKMAHPDGELATIRAAKRFKSLVTLSTYSTTSLEDVKDEAGNDIPLWFQLKTSEDLIRRAEKAGYKAIVITVDTPYLGNRRCDVRNQYSLPSHLRSANFAPALKIMSATERHSLTQSLTGDVPVGSSSDSGTPSAPSSNVDNAENISDTSLSWDKDIKWIKSITSLPIILKGILTEEDTKKAVEMGIDGIIVSNHGGRQLDTCPAAIEALPSVVHVAKNSKTEIYFDSGIRKGTDVVKALALGAKAVFVGRPILWGLAHSGSSGVSHILQILNDELRLAMALLGVTNVEALDQSYILPKWYFDRGFQLENRREGFVSVAKELTVKGKL
ncbi:FMN-dependent dehydrogenase-domain-containing protein [Paraphysoderma sedebokerense]|nr:FMN-dependent dehydrogenase-domain-containing protein [Paraphysoderma sedebokerense]